MTSRRAIQLLHAGLVLFAFTQLFPLVWLVIN